MFKPARTIIALVLAATVGFFVGHSPSDQGHSKHTTARFDLDPSKPLFYRPDGQLLNADPLAMGAAELAIRGIDNRDPGLLDQAIAAFEALAEDSQIGSEYACIGWLLQYLASPSARDEMKKNPDGARLVRFLGGDTLDGLAYYLDRKYGFTAPNSRPELRFVDEVIRFGAPTRSGWEHTDKMMDAMNIQPGHRVADIGAGSGFFTWRFSDLVGPSGSVLATEINKLHADNIKATALQEKRSNVTVVLSSGGNTGLGEGKYDRIFMCAVYQSIYLNLDPKAQAAFLEKIRDALTPDGRLIVAENTLTVTEGQPYRGTRMEPILVATHIEAHGFKLQSEHHFSPARFLQVFSVNK
jgi:protein-L-isoaspartate O-methyltransferase